MRRPTPNLHSMENAGVCDDRLSHVVVPAKARSQVGRGAQSLPGFPDPAPGSIPDICLTLTLRADFFGQALQHRPFADALEGHVVNLGPMNREELRAAIVRPAETPPFRSIPVLWRPCSMMSRINPAACRFWNLRSGRCGGDRRKGRSRARARTTSAASGSSGTTCGGDLHEADRERCKHPDGEGLPAPVHAASDTW